MTATTIRPTTAAQFWALPEGPAIGQRTEGGITTPIMPDVVAFFSHDDELLSVIDQDGQRWSLGRYRDGSWFRQLGL